MTHENYIKLVPISVPIYTALLEYSHSHSLTHCLWLLLHYYRRIRSQQRPHDLQNLKYLLSGSLRKPCQL